MSPLRIRFYAKRRPFVPFTITTTDGSQIRAISQESILLLPGNQTLVVATGRAAGGEEEIEIIDVFHIPKVTLLQPSGSLTF